jgi:6-pyruvoyltetrahydropterin/6-carboxytetrahydropterin synthase
MYSITIERSFSAAHAIRLPDGSLEPVHGHNWPVEVSVGSPGLDQIETVMDFHELVGMVDGVLAGLHNRCLNEVEPFAGGRVNPTAERVAWWIAGRVRASLPAGVRLECVRVGEAPGCYASYRPE